MELPQDPDRQGRAGDPRLRPAHRAARRRGHRRDREGALNPEPIIASLELVAERVGDPAPLVYARLFARHPETEALFVRDENGSVRGEMLAVAIQSLLDLAEQGTYGAHMIAAERVNHDSFGAPPETFAEFYPIMVETFREVLGADWTAEMTGVWDALLARAPESAGHG